MSDTQNSMIESHEIKMPPKKMLTVLFCLYGTRWFVISVAGIVIFVVLGFCINYKFFVLALIWMFLLWPLLVAFLYFYYGMEPLTAFNAMAHKIRFEDGTLKVQIIEKNEEEEASYTFKDYNIRKEDYKGMKTYPDYALFFFNKKGWLWLPLAAFNSSSDLKTLIDFYEKK